MYLSILACDLDGTLTENNEVTAETWEALWRAKAAGLHILLATGRRLETFESRGRFAELCEAIVAENGAVVYFPRRDAIVLPFGGLEPTFLDRLAKLGLPLEYGRALVATHVPHDEPLWAVLRATGGRGTIEYNRGAVMVLPTGATKGTGLDFALRELGYSVHNVVACGDAENDRSLFAVAELAVAVANADPELQALADLVTPQAGAAGVRWLISQLLTGQLRPHTTRPARRLLVGQDFNENILSLDPCRLLAGNLGIFGASASGKSWLAGLLAEQLLQQGYDVYIIDPEGEYRGLRHFPHTLLLGGANTRLPAVADLMTLDEYSKISLVLDLSAYHLDERQRYMIDLLRALRGLRQQRGQPHWLLLDEVHSLCPPGGGELNRLCQALMTEGGVSIISYRPSLVDPALLAQLDQWILMRTQLPEDLALLAQHLSPPDDHTTLLQSLPTLAQGQAYLVNPKLADVAPAAKDVAFQTGVRTVPHIRHLNKYLQAPLPLAKQFYFCDAAGHWIGKTAASLADFSVVLRTVPLNSLEYHLNRGDFERWLREVMRDEELARQLRKLSHHGTHGEKLRDELVTAVAERYALLASLT